MRDLLRRRGPPGAESVDGVLRAVAVAHADGGAEVGDQDGRRAGDVVAAGAGERRDDRAQSGAAAAAGARVSDRAAARVKQRFVRPGEVQVVEFGEGVPGAEVVPAGEVEPVRDRSDADEAG